MALLVGMSVFGKGIIRIRSMYTVIYYAKGANVVPTVIVLCDVHRKSRACNCFVARDRMSSLPPNEMEKKQKHADLERLMYLLNAQALTGA